MQSSTLLKAPLRGIIPPLATPLLTPDTLDPEGLERLVEHVLAGGVSGLFLLGTTGEGPCLSNRLRREVVQRVCQQAGLRVPILVGITDTSFAESLALARDAAKAGAHAVVIAPPPYLSPSQDELVALVERLADASPLPIFAYSIPQLTKVRFDLDSIRRLMDMPNVVGVKDSAGDMVFFHRLMLLGRQRPDWSVLMGPEELIADAALLGAHGAVCAGSNLRPRLYVDLFEAGARGDVVRARQLLDCVLRLARIYQVSRSGASFITGLKCALSLVGLCGETLTEPFRSLEPAERAQVAKLLEEIDGDTAAGSDAGIRDRLAHRR